MELPRATELLDQWPVACELALRIPLAPFVPRGWEGVCHLGFERSELVSLLGAAGFTDLGATTAVITRKESRDYPVFLITGRRAAVGCDGL